MCGGRTYDKLWRVYEVLDSIHEETPITELIQGGAAGADRLAKCWAEERIGESTEYKADWDRYGRSAGPIRNQQMLDEGKPDLVVAFPGTRGTADMIERTRKANIELTIIHA